MSDRNDEGGSSEGRGFAGRVTWRRATVGLVLVVALAAAGAWMAMDSDDGWSENIEEFRCSDEGSGWLDSSASTSSRELSSPLAGVYFDVNQKNRTVSITAVSMGNADYVAVTGGHTLNSTPVLNRTGQTITFEEQHLEESGCLIAVGTIGEAELHEEAGFTVAEIEEEAAYKALQEETWDFTGEQTSASGEA